MRIGIVGYGTVGTATASLFPEVVIYDPIKGYPESELLAGCAVVFICLPTPTQDGRQDLSILRQALDQVAPIVQADRVVAIRSTILPGTTRRLQEEYPGLRLVANPEFLRAHRAMWDARDPFRVVIGADDPIGRRWLVDAYAESLPDLARRLILTDSTTAETIKYAANCYLATKISFFNELYDLCGSLNASFTALRTALELDPRIGAGEETAVNPRNRGFDDECLPKDLDAFLTYLRDRSLPLTLLQATAEVNERVRLVQSCPPNLRPSIARDGLVALS